MQPLTPQQSPPCIIDIEFQSIYKLKNKRNIFNFILAMIMAQGTVVYMNLKCYTHDSFDL